MITNRLPNMAEIIGLALAIIATIFLFVQILNLPIQLALLICWFEVIVLAVLLGVNYGQLQEGINKGISQGMDAVLILIAVGALIGSWMNAGIVPNIIYLGLSIIEPSIFLLTAFILCSVTSLATGTSFGTVGTAGVAMIGVGDSFGLSLPLTAGAVISGAYLGDKLSPLSDTTVMTASLCKVDLIEHIKSMMYVGIPAFVIAAILFLIAGVSFQGSGDTKQASLVMDAISSHYTLAWYMFIPAIAVIALLVMKLPSMPVIFFGAGLGVLWSWGIESNSIIVALSSLYYGNSISSDMSFLTTLLNRGGISAMLDVILLVVLALGLGGLLEAAGVLKTVSRALQKWANNLGKLTLSTIFSGFLGNFFGGAAYVSLITASTITAKSYDDLAIDRRVLSRNTETGGTMTTPMVPWSDGGVFMASTLGVSTFAYFPYLWFHFLVLGITIFYAFSNKFCFNK